MPIRPETSRLSPRLLKSRKFIYVPGPYGIDIRRVEVPHPDPNLGRNITLNARDYGGQRVYRITHQFFFSRRSLYLLLWRPRMGPEQCDLEGWLKMIRLRVGAEATRPHEGEKSPQDPTTPPGQLPIWKLAAPPGGCGGRCTPAPSKGATPWSSPTESIVSCSTKQSSPSSLPQVPWTGTVVLNIASSRENVLAVPSAIPLARSVDALRGLGKEAQCLVHNLRSSLTWFPQPKANVPGDLAKPFRTSALLLAHATLQQPELIFESLQLTLE